MSKTTYERRKQVGICTQCGKNPVSYRAICEDCQKKNTQNRLARINRYKELGLCSRCGKNPRDENYSTCKFCREKNNQRVKEDRAYRKSLGLCVVCGEEAVKGKTLCLIHSMDSRESQRGRKRKYDRFEYLYKRQQRKEQGLCTKCGKRPQQHKLLCSRCYAYTIKYRESHRDGVSRSDRISQGLCYICGSSNLKEGKKICQSCYDKRMESMSKIMYMTKVEKKADYWNSLESARIENIKQNNPSNS